MYVRKKTRFPSAQQIRYSPNYQTRIDTVSEVAHAEGAIPMRRTAQHSTAVRGTTLRTKKSSPCLTAKNSSEQLHLPSAARRPEGRSRCSQEGQRAPVSPPSRFAAGVFRRQTSLAPCRIHPRLRIASCHHHHHHRREFSCGCPFLVRFRRPVRADGYTTQLVPTAS